jgi:hypothetical protein
LFPSSSRAPAASEAATIPSGWGKLTVKAPVRSALRCVAWRGLQTKQKRFSQPSGIAMCLGARSWLPSGSRVPTMTSGITMKNWLQIGELVGIGIGRAGSPVI